MARHKLILVLAIAALLGTIVAAPTATAECIGWGSDNACLGAWYVGQIGSRDTCVGAHQGDHCTGVQV